MLTLVVEGSAGSTHIVVLVGVDRKGSEGMLPNLGGVYKGSIATACAILVLTSLKAAVSLTNNLCFNYVVICGLGFVQLNFKPAMNTLSGIVAPHGAGRRCCHRLAKFMVKHASIIRLLLAAEGATAKVNALLTLDVGVCDIGRPLSEGVRAFFLF